VIVLTAGPARMADNISVSLPEPRVLDVKTSELFGEYSRKIYRQLGLS
jgi:NitT/TauT family transport system ATP-binding protein